MLQFCDIPMEDAENMALTDRAISVMAIAHGIWRTTGGLHFLAALALAFDAFNALTLATSTHTWPAFLVLRCV